MTTKFDKLLQDQEFQKAYAVESLIGNTAELIWQLLSRRNMKQADLARRLNKTPAFVSQLLSGKANMTVQTLAEVVYALGASVKIDCIDIESLGCDGEDSKDAHTFRLPSTRMELNMSSRFVFGDQGATGPKASTSDARSGYAA